MSRLPHPLTAVLLSALCAVQAAAQWPFSLGSPAAPAAAESIAWIDDPAEALQVAQQSGRPIVAYVTSAHCGYCRKMEKQTWADPGVAQLIQSGAVPLRLTRDAHPEEVAALRVRAYPTTVVLSPQGRGVAGAAGFQSPEDLTELLRSALRAETVAARQ